MKEVIIYKDSRLAAKAKALLQRATRQADEEPKLLEWNALPWRVDFLTQTTTANAALQEAADAGLIMLALRKLEYPLPALLSWLEEWALHRQNQEAALALWDGAIGDGRAGAGTSEFSQFAERHGLSFIFDDGSLVEDASVSPGSVHKPGEGQTATATIPVLEQPPVP